MELQVFVMYQGEYFVFRYFSLSSILSNLNRDINISQCLMAKYIWMYQIFGKVVKIVPIARIYYKENYLKPNSDASTLQTPVIRM